MKLHDMTDVQTRTINEALSGSDIIAQAKTGTGKTLGFLIPVVQKMINQDPALGERPRGYKRASPHDTRAIIISPTRELAEQIAVEAKKVTANTSIIVQLAVGGTQKRQMLEKTKREGCHLLIGTPGRLADILSDSYSGITAPKLNSLVLDEADRLLDQGFSTEIDEIKARLPPQEEDRQTMMFSATVPRDVVDLVRRTLKPGFHFAQCVAFDEVQTHERIPQKLIHVNGFENVLPTLHEKISKTIKERKEGESPFKAIVYFNSTAEVKLAAQVFGSLTRGARRSPFGQRTVDPNDPLAGTAVFEIHSKLTQDQRTRAAQSFRVAESAILFSSDVTARGMDFPNVTHVIQIGLPKESDTYVHRIGRTGRAGKAGEGWLLANPLDSAMVSRRLRGIPLQVDNTSELAMVDMAQETQMSEYAASLIKRIVDAHQRVRPEILSDAFRGLFGAYAGHPDKREMLEMANRWSLHGWGMPNPPPPPASFRGGGQRRSPGGFGGGPSNPFADIAGSSSGGSSSRGGYGGGRPQGGYGDRRQQGGYGGQQGGYGGQRSGGFSRGRSEYARN
jgi:ATP-dependent RNA helicase MSS116